MEHHVHSENSENLIIKLQTEKEIIALFKNFLEIIEEIRSEHKKMLNTASLNVDEEFINSIDYFKEDFYQKIRAKILDKGNDTSRNIQNFIEYFDFAINKDKMIEILKNRKSYKRTHVNSTVIIEEN